MHEFFEALLQGREQKYAETNPDAFSSGYAKFDPLLYEQPASVLARGVAVAYPVMRTFTFSVAVGYVIEWCYCNKEHPLSFKRFTEAINALKTHAPRAVPSFLARFGGWNVIKWIENGVVTKDYALYVRQCLDAHIANSKGDVRGLIDARDRLCKQFNIPQRSTKAESAIWDSLA